MAFFRKAFEKLAAGLAKTRAKVIGGLKSLFHGRKIDEQLLEEVEERMIAADFGVAAARELRAALEKAYKEKLFDKGEEALEFLKAEMKKYWPEQDRGIRMAASPPTVILVTGINGSGKTTSVAKLAHQFKLEGKKVVLAAADTFRAAAIEQLSIWAERLDVDIVRGQSGSDPAAVAYDACDAAMARKADILLVDTAGRLHTQDNLMRELTKIRNVVAKRIPGAPHEVLLVLDATTGQNAINQAKAFSAAAGITGIFLAKLDGTAKGGIVVALRNELALPVKYVGVGEKPTDVTPFDPEAFVEALFA